MRLRRRRRRSRQDARATPAAGVVVLALLGLALVVESWRSAPLPAFAGGVTADGLRIEIFGDRALGYPRSGRPAGPLSAYPRSAMVTGIVTYYGIEDGFRDGTMYCGAEFNPADPSVVAVSPGRYPCGTRLLVTDRRTNRSLEVTVKDHCGECGWDHLDLSRAAFATLTYPERGVLDVVWVVLER